MKRERQLTVYDCARTTRAIANAAGKIVFLWQDDMKKPRQKCRGGVMQGGRSMPVGLIKALLIIVFGLPMLGGLLLLVFGAWWLQFLDGKEGKHEQPECDGGR